MQKTTSVHIDDFRKRRELTKQGKLSKCYIDKTLLIKDFLDFQEEVALITRPSRFGKTLNMTMLRDFLDYNQDSHSIFEDLAIMNTEYAKKINTIPVIYLTFKNCEGDEEGGMIKRIGEKMFWEYDKYYQFFEDEEINRKKLVYKMFYHHHSKLETLGEGEFTNVTLQSAKDLIKNSLAILIKAVHNFYNIRPIVIIDDYDQPVIAAHVRGFGKSMNNIFSSIYGRALKGNPDLGQAILTGIHRVAKDTRFNNPSVHTAINDRYSQYFGLSEKEVKKLLHDLNIQIPLKHVKSYYNGYVFGKKHHMYNPGSILSFIERQELDSHWINTSTNLLIQELISNASDMFIKNLDKLLKGEEVEVVADLSVTFLELEDQSTLWGLLVNAGYLTITENNDMFVRKARIPNHEVRSEFLKIIAKQTKVIM